VLVKLALCLVVSLVTQNRSVLTNRLISGIPGDEIAVSYICIKLRCY